MTHDEKINIATLPRRIDRDPRARWLLSLSQDEPDPPPIGHTENGLTVTGYVRGKRKSYDGLAVRCDCGSPEYLLPPRRDGTFLYAPCPICTPRAPICAPRCWRCIISTWPMGRSQHPVGFYFMSLWLRA